MEATHIEPWTELALRAGPFFFALLFLFFAWRLARGPEGNARDRASRRLNTGLTLGSFSFGVLLVGVSVVWWFGRPSINVFEGTIKNLKPYEKLSSDSPKMFFREELKDRLGDEKDQLRNVRFVVVRNGKFNTGDTFEFEYRKEGGNRQRLLIPYTTEPEPAFLIEWNEADQTNLLKRNAERTTRHWRWPLVVGSAQAQSLPTQVQAPVDRALELPATMPPPPPAPAARPPRRGSASAPSPPPVATGPRLNPDADKLVLLLQDSRSNVGAKISVLDELGRYDARGGAVLMRASTAKGPVAATLLDLGRHSDPELASKARALMSKFDLESELVRQLASATPQTRPALQKLLASMDAKQSQRVFARLTPEQRRQLGAAPAPAEQPLATGSADGDRYYVRATWNPSDRKAVDCLTRLFHQTLVSRRTLQQEAELMKGRKDRLFYGYSREWASNTAGQLRSCGAESSFVVPWKSSS